MRTAFAHRMRVFANQNQRHIDIMAIRMTSPEIRTSMLTSSHFAQGFLFCTYQSIGRRYLGIRHSTYTFFFEVRALVLNQSAAVPSYNAIATTVEPCNRRKGGTRAPLRVRPRFID